MISERRAEPNIERTLWLAAVLTVGASYFGIAATYEKQISALQTASRADYAATLRNRQLAANAGRTQSLATGLKHAVSTIVRNKSQSTVTAVLVQDVDGLAAKNGCRLLSLVPSAPEESSGQAKTAAERHGSNVLPYAPFADVDVVVRGNYRAVLRFAAGISNSHTLVNVQSISLARSTREQRGSARLLDAKVHATVFSFNPAWGAAS